MVSKNKIKYIISLQKKKYRQKYNKFVIEGHKTVFDIIDSNYIIDEIYTSNAEKYKPQLAELSKIVFETTDEYMKKISGLSNANDIIAIVSMPETPVYSSNTEGITLCLADIQDPGNLGTIIRTANWFGIKNIVCSNNTVDLFNPKTLQSTMGAFCNINVYYKDLEQFLEQEKGTNIYGTFLEGENIYETELSSNCIIIMGNEGKGIPNDLNKFISDKITIPSFAGENLKAESLNVSISTAVVLSEFARR